MQMFVTTLALCFSTVCSVFQDASDPPGVLDDVPTSTELSTRLFEFETMFDGFRVEYESLRADESGGPKKNAAILDNCVVETTPDGNIRRGYWIAAAEVATIKQGWYNCVQTGLSFQVQNYSGQALARADQHLSGSTTNANSRQILNHRILNAFLFGKIDDAVSIGAFVKQSALKMEKANESGVALWELTCTHATRGTLIAIFDQDRVLRSLRVHKHVGDVYCLNDTEISVTTSPWNEEYGPIEYQMIGGKRFVSTLPYRFTSGSYRSEVTCKVTKIEPLQVTLTSRIDLPDFTIENGEFVNMGDIDPIRYEYHNGKVVKVADAQSIEAARKSQFKAPGRSRRIWYASMGGLLFAFLSILVWYRFKFASND